MATSNVKSPWRRLGGMDPRLGGFLALLALLPSAQAALLEDPEGDLRVESGGPSAPLVGPAYASIDLVALDVSEDPEAFTFTLGLADLAEPDSAPDGRTCWVSFRHGQRAFLIRDAALNSALGPGLVTLYSRDGDGPWEGRYEADLQATADQASDALTYRLARADMADASGAAPYPGRTLEGLGARCTNSLAGSSFLPGVLDVPAPGTVVDDAPELGLPMPAWPVRLGAAQSGHALLTSPQPFRASNGEATTYRFNVSAHNLGGNEDSFTLAATGVPTGLGITLASDELVLAAGERRAFDVWVEVPFAHDHGSASSFVLELRSASDPGSVGRIELGVRYLAVPQPAGHHDTLFVHSHPELGATDRAVKAAPGLYGNSGYLSTLEEDPGDSRDGLSFAGGTSAPGRQTHDFWVPLAPSLMLGLDTDLGRNGHAELVVGSRTPLEAATISAEVIVTGGDTTLVVARMEPTAVEPRGDLYAAVGELVPQPEADLVPFAPGRNLYLVATVEDTSPGAYVLVNPPWLMPGSWVQLPLLDYHDAVEGLPVGGGTVLAGPAPATAPSGASESPAPLWLAPLALAVACLGARRRA